MSDSNDMERFTKDPGLLVELCQDVIDRLDVTADEALVAEQEAQLKVIARAVDQLEKSGVAVPDMLRAEKSRLVLALASFAESRQMLTQLADEFDELLKNLRERLGQNGSGAEVKPRQKRSKLPRTSKEELRLLIIQSLESRHGRATVSEVKADLSKFLDGKLLAGDLEYRQDGKTRVWLNNVQWERLQMCRDGLIRNDSKSGVWELAEVRS
jgi:hypothetical protein